MDIFEQMEQAHIMLVNGIPTTNFGWNSDDEPEFWCFSVYVQPDDGTGACEYYFSRDDMNDATPHGDGFLLRDDVIVEFCLLVPVDNDLNSL